MGTDGVGRPPTGARATTARYPSRALLVAVLTLAIAAGNARAASASITPTLDALALGRALAQDAGTVTAAEFVARPFGGTTTAVSDVPLAGFPVAGSDYTIVSTGDPMLAATPDTSGSTGVDQHGGNVRGDTDFDVTILRVDLDVPSTANCLAGIDFRFFSEEHPEYVGSSYNDAFIIGLDEHSWTTSGSEIFAPENFAFDPAGNVISVNAAGVTSMTAPEAVGTTYDAATPLLTAATPITPGHHRLFLSIFDQGDHILDSAVFLDNLRFSHVSDVAQDCKPGAGLADPSNYVALGDSFSSGYGVPPFEDGTHKDAGPNDCQRSDFAYPWEVASRLNLSLEFHACQGAVTRDFYSSRNDGQWGEIPQLDHLGPGTGVMSFSIGGNDAKFGPVLKECLAGAELLPFNTCHQEGKVTKPVAEALARLDGRTQTPANIYPYRQIFRDARDKAQFAVPVAVGYPHLFPSRGNDRTFLPGGRCEGIKKVDQRWMVEKIDELNAIIRRNALRNGFLFANPVPAFVGHELCSPDEWVHGLLSDGRFHPSIDGHAAIADAVSDVLEDDERIHHHIVPGESFNFEYVVANNQALFSIFSQWPGSDVVMSLKSPSGVEFGRATTAPGLAHSHGPTWEHYEVTNPEAGTWTIKLHGADVAPDGEDVALTPYQEPPLNSPPVPRFNWTVSGRRLDLDATASSDADGTIQVYDWYVTQGATETVLQGSTASLILADTSPFDVTLVVTDDDGSTGFLGKTAAQIDVKPGTSPNVLNTTSNGVIPVALLSSPTFDATSVPLETLRFGPGATTEEHRRKHIEDVNGDGRPDVMLHFSTRLSNVSAADRRICLTGTILPGMTFEACDQLAVVKAKGAGKG